MIPRYSRKEMADIWSEETRFKKMLEVELAVCEAMAELKIIPKTSFENIRKNAKFDIHKIKEREKLTGHEVVAFVEVVSESVGDDGRFIHFGLTSSDVLDTVTALQLKNSLNLLISDINELLSVLEKMAIKYKNTAMIGRTHGIHAEPITFGLKVLSWYSAFKRCLRLLEITLEDVSYGKISGAVGNYAHISPKIEEIVCKKFGLKPEPVSTQIIPRDRYATYICRLAIVGSVIEWVATEIRNLQRTEIKEVEEPFTKTQKGSSAMPHKRNPILSENLCGLARLLRSYTTVALENIALWHERDISHSSAERIIFPDASILLDFMLQRLIKILTGLKVYPENMKKNLEMTKGVVSSEKLLLKLIEKGLNRESAYKLIQSLAFESLHNKKNLKELALKNKTIKEKIPKKEIEECFNFKSFFKYHKYIFEKVLK